MDVIGSEVYWNDPDNGICSGWRIIECQIDEETVRFTDGTEAYIKELS